MPPIRYRAMPKTDYKSIAISKEIYDRFKSYKDSDYGISEYVSHMLQDRVMYESNLYWEPIVARLYAQTRHETITTFHQNPAIPTLPRSASVS